ncbi:MAG: exodeoxyribonuclease V subunit alpha [Methylohalobius sp.]|nr:exodeoxyribonuclease V subunit alpha [Methylohalobius sp.]
MALAAPTGKAAQRLAETLASRIQALPLSQDLKARLPREVTTLHRLLGVRPDTCRVKYDADHPLPYDLIVVDEASMVDLALAAKLVEALPEKAGLVLLGDRYQLASVEAGSVLADLCEGAPAHTFCLTTAHRFQAQLRELAAAVQAGEIGEALDRLPRLEGMAALWRALDEGYRGYWETVHAGGDYRSVHAAFARFRALCAHRRGPLGSDWLNAELEVRWRHRGWIAGGTFYPGRAVLIQENAPDLHLFNGDVGICLEEDEELRVWFEDGRRLAPMHLPAHQTVFAMTVHKSQGSEFEEVLLVLPIQSSEVLSRELVYTAITRARSQVRCWGPQAVLREALDRRTRRRGGVRFKLTEAGL